jgi:hypothetical protein
MAAGPEQFKPDPDMTTEEWAEYQAEQREYEKRLAVEKVFGDAKRDRQNKANAQKRRGGVDKAAVRAEFDRMRGINPSLTKRSAADRLAVRFGRSADYIRKSIINDL